MTKHCGEDTNKWPRVHSCVNDWCPSRRPECERCDRLVAILQDYRAQTASVGELGKQEGGS